MACKTIDLGGGAFAIACTRGKRRALCQVCRRNPHEKLCDQPLTGVKAGKTCDLKLCRGCAVHAGTDLDLCPAHAKAREKATAP
jgi:hypothetical protein